MSDYERFECYYFDDVVLVTLNGVPNEMGALARIFGEIGGSEINLDMISQTVPYRNSISVSFTIDAADLANVIAAVGRLKKVLPRIRTDVNSGNCKFVLRSECLKTTPNVAGRLYKTLCENDLEIKLITTSDVEIEVLFDNTEIDKIERVLRAEFVGK